MDTLRRWLDAIHEARNVHVCRLTSLREHLCLVWLTCACNCISDLVYIVYTLVIITSYHSRDSPGDMLQASGLRAKGGFNCYGVNAQSGEMVKLWAPHNAAVGTKVSEVWTVQSMVILAIVS